MIEFNYNVPIMEKKTESKDFVIEGIAINATTTGNGHKFLAEELKSSAHTLTGVVLLKDHKNEVDSIMGRVIEGKYIDNKINFYAKVIDKKAQEMIKDGRLNSVSVGCMVKSIEMDETDESMIMRGITFRELSLVAVGADEGAEFGIALSEALKLNKQKVKTISEKETAPVTFTQEQLDETVAKVKEAYETKIIEDAKAKEKVDLEAKAKEAKEKADLEAKEKADKEAKEIESEAKEKEAKEKADKEKIAEEAIKKEEENNEVSDYKIVESFGTLKGGSFTVERC